MNKTELQEFTAFLLAIAEVYGKKMTDAAVMIYYEALKDLEIKAIKSSVKLHCQDPDEGKFMPLPAHIRKRLVKPEKTSIIAWQQVEKAMTRHGAYATVQFEDGVINAVVKDMGGWPWLCDQSLQEPWTQREFERRYEAYHGQRLEIHEPLAGLHESNNRIGQYLEYIPPTALIGEGNQVTMLPPKCEGKLLGEGDRDIVDQLSAKMGMA